MGSNNETTTRFNVDISELKKAMQDAKRQVQLANSEFKAVTSTMDNWNKTTDGLSAKLKQLDTNLSSQKKILSGLEDQYQAVAEKLGADSAAAEKLAIQINNQKAVVGQTEKQIRDYEEALKKAEKAEEIAKNTGEDATKVFDELGKEAEDSGKKAEKSADGFTVFKGVVSDLASTAIKSAISGLKKLASTITDTASKVDDLNTKSIQTGIDVETLQEWEYAAQFIDTDVDTITGSLSKLTKNMTSTSADVTGAFEELGISVTDNNGRLRDNKDVFFEIIDALGKVENETERDNLAMRLFGKSAQDLNPLIEAGAEGLAEYSKEAHEMGAVMDKDMIAKYAEMDDSINRIKAIGTGWIREIGYAIIKNIDIDGLSRKLKNLPKLLNPVIKNFKTFVAVIGTGIVAFKTLKAVMAIANTISAFKSAVLASTVAVNAAQKAQMAWNAAQAANVIGAVVTAVGLLTAGIVALVASNKSASESTGLLTAEQEKCIKSAKDSAEAFKETKKAADDLASSESANIDYTTKLWNELQTLTDKNGKVKEGYESRAEFILDQLNKALGSEYTMNGNIIDQYSDMVDGINSVIEAKKAEILLSAYEDSYAEAIQNVTEAEKARATAAQELALQQERYEEAVRKAKEAEGGDATAQRAYEEKVEKERKALEKKEAQYNKLSSSVKEYYAVIDNYEIASQAVIEGNSTKAIEYLTNLGDGFVTATSLAEKSAEDQKDILRQQVVDAEINLELLQDEYNKAYENMSEDERKAAEARLKAAEDQVNKAAEEYKKVGGHIVLGIIDGMGTEAWFFEKAMEDLIKRGVEAGKKAADIHSPSRLFRDAIGKFIGLGIAEGIDDSTGAVVKSMRDQINTVSNFTGLVGATTTATGGKVSGGVVNNYTQVINSPKQLSRLDIYRQSKNLLGYAGGV